MPLLDDHCPCIVFFKRAQGDDGVISAPRVYLMLIKHSSPFLLEYNIIYYKNSQSLNLKIQPNSETKMILSYCNQIDFVSTKGFEKKLNSLLYSRVMSSQNNKYSEDSEPPKTINRAILLRYRKI